MISGISTLHTSMNESYFLTYIFLCMLLFCGFNTIQKGQYSFKHLVFFQGLLPKFYLLSYSRPKYAWPYKFYRSCWHLWTQEEYGYSSNNCQLSRLEGTASRQHGCSFILTNSSSGKRCQPSDSLSISSNTVDNDCPENCVSTKYSLSLTQSDLSDSVKKYLSEKITSGKENFEWIKQYRHFLKMN